MPGGPRSPDLVHCRHQSMPSAESYLHYRPAGYRKYSRHDQCHNLQRIHAPIPHYAIPRIQIVSIGGFRELLSAISPDPDPGTYKSSKKRRTLIQPAGQFATWAADAPLRPPRENTPRDQHRPQFLESRVENRCELSRPEKYSSEFPHRYGALESDIGAFCCQDASQERQVSGRAEPCAAVPAHHSRTIGEIQLRDEED